MNTIIDKEKLVEQYGNKISGLSYRMITDRNVAEEAAQEVWYEILKSLSSFKGNSSLSTWIFTIAKRTLIRYTQNERVYTAQEFDDHFAKEAIDYTGEENEYNEWVRDLCDKCLTGFCHCLNTEARLLFLLRDLVKLPFSEISIIMDKTEENIRKIVSRSREKVKNFMERDCILQNPDGKCRCRIGSHVKNIDLQEKYRNLEDGFRVAKIIQKYEKEMPRKNYWEKFVI